MPVQNIPNIQPKRKSGMTIMVKLLIAFIVLSTLPVLFANLLTIATYEEVIGKYIENTGTGDFSQSDNFNRDLFLSEKNINIQIALVIFLTIILTAFVAMLFSRSLTDPILKLVRGTKEIASGNLKFRLDIDSPPEIGKLADSFNSMAVDLKTGLDNLKLEREKVESIITNLTEGLVVIGEKLDVLLVNPKARSMLGFSAKEKIEFNIKKGHKIPKQNKYQNLEKIISIGKNKSTLKLSKKTESADIALTEPAEMTIKVTATPLFDASGSVNGRMWIMSDITREKIIDNMKSEFITIAAHQLRTPLSAVKWAVKIVLDRDIGPLNKQQEDLLEKGYESNERMIRLINDLLNVSRIEEGRYGFAFSPVDLNGLIKSVLSDFQGEIINKNIKLEFKSPDNLPRISADPEKLYFAFENMIDNSVKYTPQNGRIKIGLENDAYSLLFKIEDNGVGIPEKVQNRIFTKFFRADNVMRVQTEGSGLGLFIVKNIIENHGGSVSFTSKEGIGTKFTVKLPLNR